MTLTTVVAFGLFCMAVWAFYELVTLKYELFMLALKRWQRRRHARGRERRRKDD